MKRSYLAVTLLGVAVLVIVAAAAWYFSTVTIRGRLVDLQGEPIDYASVWRVDSYGLATSWVHLAECDGSGRFVVPNVRLGRSTFLFCLLMLEPGCSYSVNLAKRTVAVRFDDLDLGDIAVDVSAALRTAREVFPVAPMEPPYDVTVAAPEGERLVRVHADRKQP